MTDFTIGDMITKYREIEALVEAADKAHNEEWGPYKAAMNALKVACGAELQRQKAQNYRNDDGMAYLRRGIKVTVDNRDEFLKFVTSENKWNFLDAGCLVDPVKEYLEDEANNPDAKAPPGVKVDPYVACSIRK